jgi:hypothetical protein
MTAVNFGSGTLIARRTDITNPKPAFLGILQDIEVDFERELKELYGQQNMPVDVAPAKLKVVGKAKTARIQASMMNDLMFGGTLTAAAGEDMAVAEAGTPAGVPKIITVTNAATFQEDLGVFYQATGIQLKRVAGGAEATGAYSVNEATGVYTFAVGGEAALYLYYRYNVTTLQQVVLAQQLMGTGPVFDIFLSNKYTNNAGTVNTLNLRLNACRSSKLALPFKNMDYTIQGFDFTAFADQAGNWGKLSTTE